MKTVNEWANEIDRLFGIPSENLPPGLEDLVLKIQMDSDRGLEPAVAEAKAALVGESNDAEHDALTHLMEALGYEVPQCSESDECWKGVQGCLSQATGHANDCPQKAWEKKSLPDVTGALQGNINRPEIL
jgi:hypothetical protein